MPQPAPPVRPRSGARRATTVRAVRPISLRLSRRAARLRLLLARRPRLYWATAIACAGLVGVVTANSTARLEATRNAWGETRTVVVVRSDTPTGSRPDVDLRALPVAMLPDTALDVLPPEGVAAHGLSRGQVLTVNDIVAPAVADGIRLAVPARGAPVLAVGQTALLLTVDGARCEGPVIARDEEWLDVAVPERCATAVALAVLAGDLVVAAVGA